MPRRSHEGCELQEPGPDSAAPEPVPDSHGDVLESDDDQKPPDSPTESECESEYGSECESEYGGSASDQWLDCIPPSLCHFLAFTALCSLNVLAVARGARAAAWILCTVAHTMERFFNSQQSIFQFMVNHTIIALLSALGTYLLLDEVMWEVLAYSASIALSGLVPLCVFPSKDGPIILQHINLPYAFETMYRKREILQHNTASGFAMLVAVHETLMFFTGQGGSEPSVLRLVASWVLPRILYSRNELSKSFAFVKICGALGLYYATSPPTAFTAVLTHGCATLYMTEICSPGESVLLHVAVCTCNALHYFVLDSSASAPLADQMFAHGLAASLHFQIGCLQQDISIETWCVRHNHLYSIRAWTLANLFGIKLNPWDVQQRHVRALLCQPIWQYFGMPVDVAQRYWREDTTHALMFKTLVLTWLQLVPVLRCARYIAHKTIQKAYEERTHTPSDPSAPPTIGYIGPFVGPFIVLVSDATLGQLGSGLVMGGLSRAVFDMVNRVLVERPWLCRRFAETKRSAIGKAFLALMLWRYTRVWSGFLLPYAAGLQLLTDFLSKPALMIAFTLISAVGMLTAYERHASDPSVEPGTDQALLARAAGVEHLGFWCIAGCLVTMKLQYLNRRLWLTKYHPEAPELKTHAVYASQLEV